MSKQQRFSVLIGLHERRLAEVRRQIGQWEADLRQSQDAIESLEHDQLHAAAGVDYLMYQQYLSFCAHLQGKINAQRERQRGIEECISQAWEQFRNIKRELNVFEQLQERQRLLERRRAQRNEQRAIIDQAVLDWVEKTA